MTSTKEVTVEQIGNTIIFTPTNCAPTTGYIYYPGGQVEPEIYGEGRLQSGDNEASLSCMEQQKIVIDETVEFLHQ